MKIIANFIQNRLTANPLFFVWGAAIVLMALRLIYVQFSPLDLAPDEAQYWDWSRNLDWSYYSKPPLVAWLIAVSTSWFGDTILGVRLFSVMGISLLSILAFLLVYNTKGGGCLKYALDKNSDEFLQKRNRAIKAGWLAFLLINIIPMFAAGGLLMTPDIPSLLLWTLALYVLMQVDFSHVDSSTPAPISSNSSPTLRCVYTPQWRKFLLMGLLVGLAGLAKYTVALFYPLLGLFLLVDKERRAWLFKPQIYVAGLVSLAVLTPVFYWNFTHDFVGFKHVLGQANGGVEFQPLKYLSNFFGGQLGVVSPILFLFIVWSWIVMRPTLVTSSSKITKVSTKQRCILVTSTRKAILWWFSAPIFLFFIAKAIFAKVQPNWTALALFGGVLILALAADKLASKLGKTMLILGLLLSTFITIIAHDSFMVRDLGVNWAVKKDPLRPVMGWRELGFVVQLVQQQIDQPTVVLTSRYQTASELAFYIPSQPEVLYINPGYRRQNHYDYRPWPDLQDKVVIYVREGGEIEPQILQGFKSCMLMASPVITRKAAGKSWIIRNANIYVCGGYLGLKRLRAERY